jgi:hypothetical protein
LGIPFGGQPVKHRQLARQVGDCVEDPPVNSMASFQFTKSVPSQGTTFVFGSWVCIADGEGDFRCFLVDMKSKTPAAFSQSDLDKFVNDLDDLSILQSATRIKEESVSSATSSGATTTFLGLDLFQSETRVADHDSANAIWPLFFRRPMSPSPSPYWRRTWILYSKSLKPPYVGGLRVVVGPTV